MNHSGLLLRRVSYPNQSFDSALTAPTNKQLLLHSLAAYNGSPVMNKVGVGYTLNSTKYSASLIANNYTISSDVRFDLVSLNLTTADTSGSTFGLQYWNGTTWVALTALNSPTVTSLGQTTLLFNRPIDWAVDANNRYSVRITSTGVPNFSADKIKVGEMVAYNDAVLNYAELQVRLETRQLLLQQGAEVIAFFQYPSVFNKVEVSYQINP